MPSAAPRLLSAAFPLILLQACASTPTDRLLVCNKQDASVSIFDPATRQPIAVLPTGEGPHEVAIAPDGRTAVVSDYGAQRPGSTLTVIDLVECKVLRTIELHDTVLGDDGQEKQRLLLRPHGSAFLDATHLVVTSEMARRLVIVDLAAGRVERCLTTPQTTMHMVALSPNRRCAFATSIREGNVALFALDGTEPPLIVATGDGAEGLAVNPVSGEAWVGNRAADTLSVIDMAGRVVFQTDTGDFPFRVAFSHGGDRALVTCAESGDVHVYDARTKDLVGVIEISGDASELSPMPMGITVDPDSRFAYVACGRGEFVAVLDLEQRKVIDRIAARPGPDGIGYARFVR